MCDIQVLPEGTYGGGVLALHVGDTLRAGDSVFQEQWKKILLIDFGDVQDVGELDPLLTGITTNKNRPICVI